jgi:hypothetical protein
VFIVLITVSTWAVIATVAVAVLVSQRGADAFLNLANPVSPEERQAMEDLNQANEVIADLRCRLKHANQERDRATRDEAQIRSDLWTREKKLRDIGRILDRDPAPVLVGAEERAG